MGEGSTQEVSEQQAPWTIPLRVLRVLPQWCVPFGPRCARRQAEASARLVGAGVEWAVNRLIAAYKNSPLGDEELKELIRHVNALNQERHGVDF